jgi:hypothetical protein
MYRERLVAQLRATGIPMRAERRRGGSAGQALVGAAPAPVDTHARLGFE